MLNNFVIDFDLINKPKDVGYGFRINFGNRGMSQNYTYSGEDEIQDIIITGRHVAGVGERSSGDTGSTAEQHELASSDTGGTDTGAQVAGDVLSDVSDS